MTQEKFLKLREMYLTTGSSVAADKLYKELYNIGMFMLYRTRLSQEDREDTVALAIVGAFNGLEGYKSEYSYKTWYGRIVKNKMIDCIKRNNVRGGFNNWSIDSFYDNGSGGFNPFELPDTSLNPLESTDMNFKKFELHKRIYAMPDGINKQVIILHIIEQLSNKEIMAKLNLGKSYVAQIIYRFKSGLGGFKLD